MLSISLKLFDIVFVVAVLLKKKKKAPLMEQSQI